jgi:D-glycero-alpha-D-manno-heptose 1-phosphate guanylyltransferase
VLGASQPKALAEVGGRPFLDSLLDKLLAANLTNVTLSVGHLAEEIQSHYELGYKSLRIRFISESEPLGTGGAIMHCAKQIEASYLLAMNGDTILDLPLGDLLEAMDLVTDGVSLVSQVPDTTRFGRLEFDDTGHIQKIQGAGTPGEGFVYAGVSLLRLKALLSLPHKEAPFGFESSILSELSTRRSLRAVVTRKAFLDIGTPESLETARTYEV